MAKEKKQLKKLTDEELEKVTGGVMCGMENPVAQICTETMPKQCPCQCPDNMKDENGKCIR